MPGRFALVMLLTVVLGTLGVPAALADDPGFPVPVDENGYLDVSKLTFKREVTEWVDGLYATTPWGQKVGFPLTYQAYTDAAGHAYLVPTTVTALLLATSGHRPFGTTPSGYIENPLNALVQYMGGFEGLGLSRKDAESLIGKPSDLFSTADWAKVFKNTYINNPLFWIRLNIKGWQNGEVFPAWKGLVLIYDRDRFDLALKVPTPGPGADGKATPGPNARATAVATAQPTSVLPTAVPPKPPEQPKPRRKSAPPEPRLFIQDGEVKFCSIQPPYPTVVGQDEFKRGVDVCLTAKVPPVIHEYDVWVGKPTMADPDAGYWEHRVDRYVDAITEVWVWANLSKESIYWIEEGDLQWRYPGATVRKPNWQLRPSPEWVENAWVNDDQSYEYQGSRKRVQFEDPGVYELTASVRTAGTPVSQPRHFTARMDIRVRVLTVTLIN